MAKKEPSAELSKEARLQKEIKDGSVIAKPECDACDWKGDQPCISGAGCPECGARLSI